MLRKPKLYVVVRMPRTSCCLANEMSERNQQKAAHNVDAIAKRTYTEERRNKTALDSSKGWLVLEPNVGTGTGISDFKDGAIGKAIDNGGPFFFHNFRIGANPRRGVRNGLAHHELPELHLAMPRPFRVESVRHAVQRAHDSNHGIVAGDGLFLVDNKARTDTGRVSLSDTERPRGAVGAVRRGNLIALVMSKTRVEFSELTATRKLQISELTVIPKYMGQTYTPSQTRRLASGI